MNEITYFFEWMTEATGVIGTVKAAGMFQQPSPDPGLTGIFSFSIFMFLSCCHYGIYFYIKYAVNTFWLQCIISQSVLSCLHCGQILLVMKDMLECFFKKLFYGSVI